MYETKESALRNGLYQMGYGNPQIIRRVLDELPEPVKKQAEGPKMIEVFTVRSPAGKEVLMQIEHNGQGYDVQLQCNQ
jgi:hypothetical protein